MHTRSLTLGVYCAMFLAACVGIPAGPTVMVLPGPQKSFAQFQNEDTGCRQYAHGRVAPAGQEAENRAVSSAVAGTAIGAAAGAAIGAASGQPGSGAAIGAGTGLLVGSAAGSDSAYGSNYELQHQYDMAYMQCMYAQGNQLPRQVVARPSAAAGYPPPNYPPPGAVPQGYPPYPPPNTPPPQGVAPE